MRVLIIGGAGYIGSHVARTLLDQGDEVTVYDNLSTGSRENLFGEAHFIHGDIHDATRLRIALEGGFDGVVHLAALKAAGESMVAPEKYAANNISGTITLLNACLETGIKNLIFSSSAAVYGEPCYIPVDEKHPTQPANFYGFTKLQIEELLDWYDRLKGLRFSALRYFNAAGYDVTGRITGLEKKPENLVPVIMEVARGLRKNIKIFGDDWDTRDGTCIRDYIHVSDLAIAHRLALVRLVKHPESFIVNLGSEQGVTVHEMIRAAREITGQEIPTEIVGRRLGDTAKVVASSSRATALLGWRPRSSDVTTIVGSTWKMYQRELRA